MDSFLGAGEDWTYYRVDWQELRSDEEGHLVSLLEEGGYRHRTSDDEVFVEEFIDKGSAFLLFPDEPYLEGASLLDPYGFYGYRLFVSATKPLVGTSYNRGLGSSSPITVAAGPITMSTKSTRKPIGPWFPLRGS